MKESVLTGESKDIVLDNISKLKELFPEIVNEDKIDFDELKLILGENIDDSNEKYSFTWPGKTQAIKESQKRSTATLRPYEKESKNWNTTQNLYIEGDNLEVLKLLQKGYYNKIKCIYIDPPYNTGNDLIYKNDFQDNLDYYLEVTGQLISENNNLIKLSTNTESNGKFHSNWLNLMYPRLKLARDLLTNDDCIVIAIDSNELGNVIKLCDEIFGIVNRVGIVTVVHKPEGRNQEKFFATSNEYAVFYAKNKEQLNFNPIVIDESIKNTFEFEDGKGKYKLNSFIAKNHGRKGFDKNLKENNPKNHYPIYVSNDLKDITLEPKEGYSKVLPNTKTQERTWKLIKETFLEKLNAGEIIAQRDKFGEIRIFEKYRISKGQLIKTHWIDKRYNANTSGTKILDDLMQIKTFDFPKSIYLVEDTIKLLAKDNDYVLDFFSGSGTTAHSIMKINSEEKSSIKFILIQLPELVDENSEAFLNGYNNLCEIAKERVRRAGDKIIKESHNKNLDIGFKVFKLDSSNLEKWDPDYNNIEQSLIVNQIKNDRTNEDLVYEIMLEYGIDLTYPIKQQNNIYSVGFGALVICLDDNIALEIVDEILEFTNDSSISRVVFKESGFKSDADKTNIKQILKENHIDEFITI